MMLYLQTAETLCYNCRMKVILDYIYTNYITLIILATIILMTCVSKKNDIKGTWYIHLLVLVVFILSVVEYVEIWADMYNKSYRILYYKTTLVYWLYPLLALLLLYITGEVKRKGLVTIPLIINMVITAIDLAETGIVYRFTEDHHYRGGPLSYLPIYVEIFYVVLLAIYSVRCLSEKQKQKGIVVLFMAVIVFITQTLGALGMESKYMPTIAAIEVLTYYYYLSAVEHGETLEALAENRIKLEQNKNNLLLAQIRPHFINSNLAVIRSLCYEEPEKAVEMIDHFSEYLRENIKQIDDSRLVPFKDEMESVENYLYLEMQRFQDRVSIEEDLQVTDFYVPPLSIQTIVENAVRHGISMTGLKGTIWISTRKEENETLVIVKDNGKGFDPEQIDFDGANHVGVKNVKDRYKRLLGGHVDIESKVGEGTVVTFHIPDENDESSLEEW